MTANEIKTKIKELEGRQFILMMKDRWNAEDWHRDNVYTAEIRRLKEELKKIENQG